MAEGFFHQVPIQLEKDEKSTNFTTKEISPTSSSKNIYSDTIQCLGNLK